MVELPLQPPAAPAATPAATNVPEFSVGDLSRAIRSTLEGEFARVRVRGEVSNFKRHGSGHLYFRLKDDEAVLEAFCWRQSAARLTVRPRSEERRVGTECVSPGRSRWSLDQ